MSRDALLADAHSADSLASAPVPQTVECGATARSSDVLGIRFEVHPFHSVHERVGARDISGRGLSARAIDGREIAIAGVVQDPDAKAVVGAVVMSRNEQSGEMQTTTTDGRGHFQFAVPPGTLHG